MRREQRVELRADERHVHAAEQTKEVEECVAALGRSPVGWLLDNFEVGPPWCLVHATHMNERETVALARSGAVAGLCPITEANLGDGIFPASVYVRAGGRFGVGSDLNIAIGAPEELRQLEYAQRLTHRARNVLAQHAGGSTGRRLYDAALAGGARALGRRIGSLEAGRRADIVILDADHPDLTGRREDAWLDAALAEYAGQSRPEPDGPARTRERRLRNVSGSSGDGREFPWVG